jgi:potassium/hydrogen antiporter
VAPDEWNAYLVTAALVLLVSAVAVRVSSRIGLPSLLLYLGIGLLIGEAGLGLQFEDVQLTQNLGLFALALILAEGGLTTRWQDLRPSAGVALVLSSVGVAVSVLVTATVAYYVMDMSVRTALLLGCVVSSTDAAAVFSVLRRLPLRGRVGAVVESESSFNDPPVVILAVVLSSDGWDEADVLGMLGQFGYQLVVGFVVGGAVGGVGAWVLTHASLPAAARHPLVALAVAVLAYGGASLLSASGFVAAYLCGIILGNSQIPHRNATLAFAEGVALLSQVGLFVLLGLLASPTRLPEAILPALVVGVGLTFVARPLSVWLCAAPFGFRVREMAFMSWAGLRGAVPIVLTTIPASEGVPGSTQIFDIVFLLVVAFTLVQAPPLPWVARRLGVAHELHAPEVVLESSPVEALDADLVTVTVPVGSRLHGVSIADLRLPHGAAVSLVVHRGEAIVPSPQTLLSEGDRLLVVATRRVRRQTEERLRAVGRRGRLAFWYGERGAD